MPIIKTADEMLWEAVGQRSWSFVGVKHPPKDRKRTIPVGEAF